MAKASGAGSQSASRPMVGLVHWVVAGGPTALVEDGEALVDESSWAEDPPPDFLETGWRSCCGRPVIT